MQGGPPEKRRRTFLGSQKVELALPMERAECRLRKVLDPKELCLAGGEDTGGTGCGQLVLGGSARGDQGSAGPRSVLMQVSFSRAYHLLKSHSCWRTDSREAHRNQHPPKYTKFLNSPCTPKP